MRHAKVYGKNGKLSLLIEQFVAFLPFPFFFFNFQVKYANQDDQVWSHLYELSLPMLYDIGPILERSFYPYLFFKGDCNTRFQT